jgi:hypothetical protein
MSVEVQYVGRLGNHLFQYAFGRIVAEALGYELRCVANRFEPPSWLGRSRDAGGVAMLPELTEHFVNAPQIVPGKRVAAPEARYLVGEDGPEGPNWDGHRIDLERLLADRGERRLVLRGYFQRYEYYRAHRAKIRDWFALAPLSEPYGIGKRDVVINIRRGWDYALKGWVLALSSYAQLLRTIPHDRVFVCGTAIDDGARAALAEFSPIYHRATPVDELRFMMKFDKIIQSNSSFCWWAAFLSDATEVYAPRPERGYFADELGGLALDTGEPRYRRFDARVARFVPFRRNPHASVSLGEDGGATFVIVDSDGGTTKIAGAPPLLRFYPWLVERREAFGLDELARLGVVTQPEAESLLRPLVDAGALVVEERFVED